MQWHRGAAGVSRARLACDSWHSPTVQRLFASQSPALRWEASYDSTKLSSLVADHLLFRLSKSKWFVDAVRSAYQSKSLQWFMDPVMRSVFDRFCGGDSFSACIPVAHQLSDKHGVKAMLDHCTEELHSQSSMNASARNKMQLIERIRANLAGKVRFLPLKPTSLVHPCALEAVTQELLRNPALTHCVQPSSIVLSNEHQRQLSEGLDRLREVSACARRAGGGIALLLDAEQSHRQPAVHWLYSLLAREFNQLATSRDPLLYNTYQCYLSTTPQTVERDMAFSIQHELALGVKLVRGAYLSSELQHAHDLRVASPLHPSKIATDGCYRALSHHLLHAIAVSLSSSESLQLTHKGKDWSIQGQSLPRQPWLSVIFATHSRSSLDDVLLLMKDLNPQGDPAGVAATAENDASSLSLPAGIFHHRVSFAQIKGICDHLTEALGHAGYDVHKLVLFGDLSEIAPWLFRRLEENRDGLGALAEEQHFLQTYLRRRLARLVGMK